MRLPDGWRADIDMAMNLFALIGVGREVGLAALDKDTGRVVLVQVS